MKNVVWSAAYILTMLVAVDCRPGETETAKYSVAGTLAIDEVPSWFPVGFSLLTHNEQQYVAYYNKDHQMIVARRDLTDRRWQRIPLPSKVGWDSHNYVTMALDTEGHLHVSGNMHGDPLVYFRTRRPDDITTFEQHAMTGQEEQRCTYPRFLRSADGTLLFMYRDGGSGNGRRLCNSYDVSSKTWTRFLHVPLFDGEDQRNAYPRGPIKGPDGYFHVVWVWRDTPDCATNHHLSYARSRDLKHWETAGGVPVRLPLTLGQSALCVDPIPPGGGIINGCEALTFDSQNRPVISYHKRDKDGHMQIYVTRFEDGRWQRHPVTNWDQPIAFAGRGAMPFIGIAISPLKRLELGMFYIAYRHRDFGSGQIVLNEETLRPVERDVAVPREYPKQLMRPTIDVDGIRVKLREDLGDSGSPDTKYVLRWETLAAHYDRPRKPPLPPPSTLTLVRLRRAR